LGEISPGEFELFIGKDIRLDPVILTKEQGIKNLLEYYMGKNTPDRQQHIIRNLRVEVDFIGEEQAKEEVEAELLN
jgi:topoisomerase-4 subunit B